MRCDTCKQDSNMVLRVVIAKDYNRALARPLFNCPACFERKEAQKPYRSGPTTKEDAAGRKHA